MIYNFETAFTEIVAELAPVGGLPSLVCRLLHRTILVANLDKPTSGAGLRYTVDSRLAHAQQTTAQVHAPSCDCCACFPRLP